MASERVPEEPHRTTFDDDKSPKPAVLDSKPQPDPGLPETPASSGRIAIYTVGIAVVLGTVFYGLDSSSINYAGTTPTAENAVSASPTQNNAQPPQMTAQTSPPLAPPGMRDGHPASQYQFEALQPPPTRPRDRPERLPPAPGGNTQPRMTG